MIYADALKPGLVVRDPGSPTPERAFYKLDILNPDTNKWEAEHIATGKRAMFDPDKLYDFEAAPARVSCEIDLSPLIGYRVRATLKWGQLSGVLSEVRCVAFVAADVACSIPSHVVVGGDAIPVAEIVSIELL